MNRRKKILMTGMIALGICFAGCGKMQVENPYGDIVAGLGDEDAYAFLVTDNDYHVMVTSDHLYDEGEEKQAAIYCTVYYSHAGETKAIGEIMSEGTAYPISFSRDGIFAASAHSIEKYVVSDQDGLLHLEQGVYENFDESGNASYVRKAEETEAEAPITEAAYQLLADEYAASRKVHFSYGAEGCVNEIAGGR